MNADGSDQKALPMTDPGFDIEPRWSPDGQWIAFNRLRMVGDEFQLGIFIVPAEGGRVKQLTPWELNAEHPNWSPDSRRILYNLSPDGSIESMRSDGSERQAIVSARKGFGGHKPWFSPDGTRIVFMCETQGTLPEPPADYNEDICIMDADGSDIVNITNTPDTMENWPSWGAPTAAGTDDGPTQVADVPVGGAGTGGGSDTDSDPGTILALGAAVLIGGAAVVAAGRLVRRPRSPE